MFYLLNSLFQFSCTTHTPINTPLRSHTSLSVNYSLGSSKTGYLPFLSFFLTLNITFHVFKSFPVWFHHTHTHVLKIPIYTPVWSHIFLFFLIFTPYPRERKNGVLIPVCLYTLSLKKINHHFFRGSALRPLLYVVYHCMYILLFSLPEN